MTSPGSPDDFARLVLNTCDEFDQKLRAVQEITQLPFAQLLLRPREEGERIARDHRRISLKIGRVRASGGNPLHIALLGNFNAGKSTLVNALGRAQGCNFNQEVGDTPTTRAITLIQYGKQQESEGHPSRDSDVLVKFFEADFLRNVVLVDTPGTNDRPQMDELVEDYLDEVDLLVLVTPADQITNESDQKLLQTKFERFPQAPALIVVTKIGHLCPATFTTPQGKVIRNMNEIDAEKAARKRDEFRLHLRERFPVDGDRLALGSADTRSLWLVDSEADFQIQELSDYLFTQYGQEEESRRKRQEMLRARLRLYAGDVVRTLVTPLAGRLAEAAGRLNGVSNDLTQAAAQRLSNAAGRAETLEGLLRQKAAAQSFRNALTSFDLPGKGDVEKALALPADTLEAVRRVTRSRHGEAARLLEGLESGYFLKAGDRLERVLKNSEPLQRDWLEVQSADHLLRLQRAYAHQVRDLTEDYPRFNLVPALDAVLPQLLASEKLEPAWVYHLDRLRERARLLDEPVRGEEVEADLRRAFEACSADLRQVLLNRRGPDRPGEDPYSERVRGPLREWLTRVQEEMQKEAPKMTEAARGAVPRRLTRAVEEACQEALDSLKDFAPQFAVSVREMFELKQSVLLELGLQQQLAALAEINHLRFLDVFDERLARARQQLLDELPDDAAPLARDALSAWNGAREQAEAAVARTAEQAVELAEEKFRAHSAQTEWTLLTADTAWHEVGSLDLPWVAREHELKLQEALAGMLRQLQDKVDEAERQRRAHRWQAFGLSFALLGAGLLLLLLGEATGLLHVPFLTQASGWAWVLVSGVAASTFGALWAHLRKVRSLSAQTRDALEQQLRFDFERLENQHKGLQEQLREQVSGRLKRLGLTVHGLVRRVSEQAQKKLDDFRDESSRLLEEFQSQVGELTRKAAGELETVGAKLRAATDQHYADFHRRARAQFLEATQAFMDDHLERRTAWLKEASETLDRARGQLDQVARFLTEPPAESALRRTTE